MLPAIHRVLRPRCYGLMLQLQYRVRIARRAPGSPPSRRARAGHHLCRYGGSMSYTLGEAARATGKSKPTIARAIRAGRISAARGDDGTYSIEPAELHRLFPLSSDATGSMTQSVPRNGTGDAAEHQARLVLEQAETIRDLRARLDSSEAERRQLQTQLTRLLTGPPARSWWPWRRKAAP